METAVQQNSTQLEAGLEEIRRSPSDRGIVHLIVKRLQPGEREIATDGQLNCDEGLVGDTWKLRGSRLTDDGSAHIDMQLTILNSRAIALIAQSKDRWALAGDQFFVDFDLSEENLPAGAQLQIGSAVVEVTALPHTGCKLFAERYGTDAVKFVNSAVGRQLRLRGVNAKVVQAGTVRVGDAIAKRLID
jgi:hypothetical protein